MICGEGTVENEPWRRNRGEGTVEKKPWRRNRGK
jgi:hypothetical protein